MFVFSFLRVAYFLARPDPPRFRRRRGFSSRATAAIFVVTIINFLLFSWGTGIAVAQLIVIFRKAFTLDTEYPLPEKLGLVYKALQNLNIVDFWAATLPVSSNLSLLDSTSIHTRRRYYQVI